MEENKEVDLAAQIALREKELAEVKDRLALTEVEKENYKTVALKRKGKLDLDDDFFGQHDEGDVEKLVSKKVAETEAELKAKREIEERIKLAEAEAAKAKAALDEVMRAKDNQPPSPVGSGGATGETKVKDSIFSDDHITQLKSKWTRMGFSEEAQTRMLDTEKKNALARRSAV